MIKLKFILIYLLFPFLILRCKYYYFGLSPNDFIEQVKSHKDTLKIKPLNLGLNIFTSLILRSNAGYDEYCNYKKYYIFYNFDKNKFDTINIIPYMPIMNGEEYVTIITKDKKVYRKGLLTLKVIDSSLINIYIYYDLIYKSKKKHVINIANIDTVIYKIKRKEYKNNYYRYYKKNDTINCVTIIK